MGTPFDLSQWLLTPPIPDFSNSPQQASGSGTQAQAGPSNPRRSPPASQPGPSNPPQPSSAANGFPAAAYGVDPGTFQSQVAFQMPSFLIGNSADTGPAIMEPSIGNMPGGVARVWKGKGPQQPFTPTIASSSRDGQANHDPNNPVFGLYGSSVISVNPDRRPNAQNRNKDDRARNSNSPKFDPASVGLAISPTFPKPLPGLYSTSGFDMLGVLARVAARPNPQIDIGPVDMSCAFVVVDARRYDMPIVYASQSFLGLTGYDDYEVIGRNCRFLQSPDGEVAPGSSRKFTDGSAAFHIKSHLVSGKESQASVVNYKKGGEPFVNLITIVPITWEGDEVSYFVGFQVDLIKQPNLILDKIKAGTYVVNYSLLPNAPVYNTSNTISADQLAPPDALYDLKPTAPQASITEAKPRTAQELLTLIGENKPAISTEKEARSAFNQLILDNTADLIMVLTLKGSILFASSSAVQVLEFEPEELLRKPIEEICHPGDIASLLKEIKNLTASARPQIDLLFRARKKSGSYAWIEAHGKIYEESGNNRKCAILVARPKSVYKLKWSDVLRFGGIGASEFWSKLCPEGMILYTSAAVSSILNFAPTDLIGSSLFSLAANEMAQNISDALQKAACGTPGSVQLKLRNRKGLYNTYTVNFYPNSYPIEVYDPANGQKSYRYPSIVSQTIDKTGNSKDRTNLAPLPRPSGIFDLPRSNNMSMPPSIYPSTSTTSASNSPTNYTYPSVSGNPTSPTAPSPTYANHPSQTSDNIFVELEPSRNSSWQYEYSRLRSTNRRLKEELANIEAVMRKRKRDQPSPAVGTSTSISQKCMMCGTTSLQNPNIAFKQGPGGGTFCNTCSSRWAAAGSYLPTPQTSHSSSQSSLAPAQQYRDVSQEPIDSNNMFGGEDDDYAFLAGYQPQ